MSSTIPNLAVATSEAFLALFPQIVKQNDEASVQIQTSIRVLTIAAAAWVYVRTFEKRKTSEYSLKSGFVNFVHIIASYTAFKNMDSSDALTIFYSYPVWNILLARVMLKEEISVKHLPVVVLSLVGVFLVLNPTLHVTPRQKIGVIAAIVAAVSESYNYILFHDKSNDQTPSENLLEQYAGTIPFVLAWILFTQNFSTQTSNVVLTRIFLFNLFIGFGMHLLRAYGARYARPESFAVLSTTGVLFGFVYQYVFEKKAPSPLKLFGGLLIVLGGSIAAYMDYKDSSTDKSINQENEGVS
jgi:drug/metabolite transporter (DMT)-like permease